MKLMMLLVIGLVIVSAPVTVMAATSDWVVVKYEVFDQEPAFELVLHRATGRVAIRVYSPAAPLDEDILELLRSEAIRLSSGREPQKLGETGFNFKLLGGSPMWQPFIATNGKIGFYECLLFAEGGQVNNNLITAWGRVSGPDSWSDLNSSPVKKK